MFDIMLFSVRKICAKQARYGEVNPGEYHDLCIIITSLCKHVQDRASSEEWDSGPIIFNGLTSNGIRLGFTAFLGKSWAFTFSSAPIGDPTNLMPSMASEPHKYGEGAQNRLYYRAEEVSFPNLIALHCFHGLQTIQKPRLSPYEEDPAQLTLPTRECM